jgi:DNA-binding winged helix-turn-helix (wHTH) protein
VHVRRLRAKLGSENEALIGTVRNVGYKFVPAKPESRTIPPVAEAQARQVTSGQDSGNGKVRPRLEESSRQEKVAIGDHESEPE